MCRNVAVTPIAQLREAIIAESQGIVQDPHALAKHLPLRLLNTNASCTLAFAHEQGYMPGGRLSALFWEIENLRDHHLPAMLSRYRTDLEVSFRNRSYHACETIESRFMQHFFHNLCKRERISSAIWLHDGMWIAQEVSDDAIRLAEVESLRHVFPGIEEQEPIFTIASREWQ